MTTIPGQARAGSLGLWLLVGLILIRFFPLPVLPGVNLAPENFLFLAALLLYGGRLSRLAFSSGRLSAVVMLLVLFSMLDVAHDFLRGGVIGNPGRHLRAAVYILLLADVCSYPATRRQILKLLVVVGVIQVVFGSLVFFIGEPFASIRDWMLHSSDTGEMMIGEGSQIAGLYGPPHIFSYLLASFPFLAVGLYQREKKLIWLAALVVLVLGLFLNAERASAAVFFVGVLYLVLKAQQRARNLVLLAVLALAFIGMQQLIGSRAPGASPGAVNQVALSSGTLADRFGGTSIDEVVTRIMYQVHGITSVLKHPVIGPTQREYAREVIGGDAVFSGVLAAEVLAPHNHYINVGVRAGVPGWLVLLACLWALWKAQRTLKAAVLRTHPDLRIPYLCFSVGLLAVMGNAVFHNAGIFSPELATSTMVGLLLALWRQVQREPVVWRTAPAPDGEAEPVGEPGRGTPRA
ncbi:MAG: hypothetical protein IT485_02900 [Gammaproteobacteria bacterium]|nr:hypothetical protein [Gammaproteobacteria bacterium]QOJ31999.1 MAG: hypothetical protein HRU81_07780 [Gammaproteobacteria bacterium]